MTSTTPLFKINPSLSLSHSAREEGAAGAVAVGTSAKKSHWKKARGSPQTFKVSNNFGAPGRRNPPQAAKLNSAEIELGTPKKRPVEGTPQRMARGGEVKFLFHLDCKRVYAAWGAQARPPAGAAKYGDPEDRANQSGAPKLPAKGGCGLIFTSSNEDGSDNNNIMRGGATKPAVRQALAATKDRHSVRTIHADEDDLDNDKSASAGVRNPAWLRASATLAKLDGGGGGISCKTKGGHGHMITSRGEDGLDGNDSAPVGAKKPTLLRTLASATVRSKVSARRGDGGAGIYPDNGITAAARSAPGAKGRMSNDGSGAALESIMGAEVVRRVLAALRDDIYEESEQDDNNEEEPSHDSNNDGSIITQDDNTEDNETSDGEAPKVQ
jgi:hypothetical protein